MKILVLAPQPFFQHRGTPIAVRELARTLGSNGHTIDLLVYHEGEAVDIDNCEIHRIGRIPIVRNVQPGFSWKKLVCDAMMLPKAFSLASRNRYDVVHAVEESAFIGILLQWRYRVPYVYDMDSSLPGQLADKLRLPGVVVRGLRRLERTAIRRSIGVLAMCQALADAARELAPSIPIGLLEDKNLADEGIEGTETLRDELSLRGPIIMYVGNLEPYQGIDLLLAAHRRVLQEFPMAELVVIGGAANHIRRYKEISSRSGVAERTHFIGPRPSNQLGHFLRQADILVSPRIKGENTPMKIYSYLGSGVPVVATRLPTHTQVLNDDFAQLVDANEAMMASGIQELLRRSDLRSRLGERAKRHADIHFGAEAFDRKLLAFYARIEESIQKMSAAARPRHAEESEGGASSWPERGTGRNTSEIQ